MALFLTGGGDQENFHKLDKRFIESLPQNANIGILAQATDDPQDALERIEESFHHNKIKNFELVTKPDSDLLIYDAIMIEGGNTFELIKAIRDTAFYDNLKNYYRQGKTIYADSAGAIMLGSSVQTAFLGDDGDEDHQKLQDYRGLNLIDPWCIHAHSTPDDFEDLNDLLYDKAFPILALAEETGILFDDYQVEVFGKEPLEVVNFAGRESHQEGSKINLSEDS